MRTKLKAALVFIRWRIKWKLWSYRTPGLEMSLYTGPGYPARISEIEYLPDEPAKLP